MHAEVVVEVAVIAIARKVIILDLAETSGLSLLGLAAIIVALAGVFLVLRRRGNHRAAGKPEDRVSSPGV